MQNPQTVPPRCRHTHTQQPSDKMCHTCTHTSTLRHWAGTSLKDWKQLKLSSAVALGRPVAARGELPQCISLSVSATHSDMRERDAALSETHCRTIHAHPHRDFVSCWSFTSFCVLFWGVCVWGGAHDQAQSQSLQWSSACLGSELL